MRNDELWMMAGMANQGYSVEEIPVFKEKGGPNWDKDVSMNTALRAIWLLYRRDHWELLCDIGLCRSDYEAKFKQFDQERFPDKNGLLRTSTDARSFAEAVPGVRVAAAHMIGVYKEIMAFDGYDITQMNKKNKKKKAR